MPYPNPNNSVNFDRLKLMKLKREYSKAIREKKESFVFEGNLLLVNYAKYLIQFLEMKFK